MPTTFGAWHYAVLPRFPLKLGRNRIGLTIQDPENGLCLDHLFVYAGIDVRVNFQPAEATSITGSSMQGYVPD